MEENKQGARLPDNAYRELAPGETYEPIMTENSKPKEVTVYSVSFGIIMAIIFSAAAAYLGLKVGQVFEAAIPIAIIAVGVGNIAGKKNMLGQNVIIQSIGASSGVIVAGAIFTCRRSIFWVLKLNSTRFLSHHCWVVCWVLCCSCRSENTL